MHDEDEEDALMFGTEEEQRQLKADKKFQEKLSDWQQGMEDDFKIENGVPIRVPRRRKKGGSKKRKSNKKTRKLRKSKKSRKLRKSKRNIRKRKSRK